jgi:hypothetical protein
MQGKPKAGAGRAIEAAFARQRGLGGGGSAGGDAEARSESSAVNRQSGGPSSGAEDGTGDQQAGIAGPGYPVADRDGADPGEMQNLENDEWADMDLDGDDEGAMDDGDGGGTLRAELAPPEAGGLSIEEEPFDTSILSGTREDKAAWNRERLKAAAPGEFGGPEQADDPALDPDSGAGRAGQDRDDPRLQTGEADEAELSTDPARLGAQGRGGNTGFGGDVGQDRDERRQGLGSRGTEAGHGRMSLRPEDERLDPDFEGEVALGEEMAMPEDGGTQLPDPDPFLPEHRDFRQDGADDEIPLEERLIAGEGEDPSFLGGEIGTVESLEPEDLNETDDIATDFEDMRDRLNDSMDGNERHGRD